MIIRVHPTGKDAAGLTRYLFGPGRANEHSNQRMLAGSGSLVAEWGAGPLTMAEATHLGRVVEAAWRRQYAPELALAGTGCGGISSANLTTGDDALPGQAHVFHASLSLHRDDAPLTDEQWAELATDYVKGMGFVDDSEHPDCQWYAVHHGPSEGGNDHIHVAVCLTRRDGSTVSTMNTGRRSQQVRREVLEKRDYLRALHDEQRHAEARSLPGYTAKEHQSARERGRAGAPAVPDRVALQRIVRAAAATSTSEVAWMHAVVDAGVRLEAARWAPGGRDRVTGYKVSIGDGPWFAASKLAPDLTLGRLRQRWTETPQTTARAVQLWREEGELDPVPAVPPAAPELAAAADQLRRFNDHLAQLDSADTDAWTRALAAATGTTTVLSTGPDPFASEAGRVADTLARQMLATVNPLVPSGPEPQIPGPLSGAEMATRHLQLALRASHTDQQRGWLAVIQQLARTVDAIRAAQQARGELVAAHALTRDARGALHRLEHQLHAQLPRERDSERQQRERIEHERAQRPAPAHPVENGEQARDAISAARHAFDATGTEQPMAHGRDARTSTPAGDRGVQQDREQRHGRGL